MYVLETHNNIMRYNLGKIFLCLSFSESCVNKHNNKLIDTGHKPLSRVIKHGIETEKKKKIMKLCYNPLVI